MTDIVSSYDEGATPLGYIRLLIGDTSTTEGEQLFSDSELNALLCNEDGPLLAAASALDIMASQEALLSKKITTQDLATDGPAVAAELRKQAAALRARAKEKVTQVTEEWAFQPFALGPQCGPELTERGWW